MKLLALFAAILCIRLTSGAPAGDLIVTLPGINFKERESGARVRRLRYKFAPAEILLFVC